MGNLTRDPEVRYTPKGNAVTDLGLAVNRSYTLDSGERREEVTFVDITVWGRQAELAGQYLHKGRPVFVEGRLQLDSWEDKNTGEKRNKLKVVCEQMKLIGGRSESGPVREHVRADSQEGYYTSPGAPKKLDEFGDPVSPADEDNIPF